MSTERPEDRFRLIAENLREAIWISDPAYTVQYYLSPAYERIWGTSIERAMAQPRSFLESVVPEDRVRVEDALESYPRGEYAVEYRIARPEGDVRWVSARGYPVRDAAGEIYRIVGIAEDITEAKHVEQERERLLELERHARTEAESAVEVRDRVLRIVSHDLKNPLHTIGMAAELIEMGVPAEQQARQLGIIRRTVERANQLVMDLLDAARIQSGRTIAITPAMVDVEPVVGEVLEAFRLQAEDRNQDFASDAERDLRVFADRGRLVQALSNLVGNAIKFTPEGGRIRIGAHATDDAVRFSVRDTGRGIAPDLLPHLFDPFSQAKETASLGSGLGLSIVHGIVSAHGSYIEVDTAPGDGTSFSFTLPTDASGGMADRRLGERRTFASS